RRPGGAPWLGTVARSAPEPDRMRTRAQASTPVRMVPFRTAFVENDMRKQKGYARTNEDIECVTRGSGAGSRRSAPMSVMMPVPDAAVLARRDEIISALRAIVPGEGVIAGEREMRPFESDGLTAYRQLPMVVVLPSTTEQVSRILAYCHAHGVKVVP